MILAALLFITSALADDAPCTQARDYITTLEFLRMRKELALPEAQARKVSSEVVRGCLGSAGRFIRAVETLTRAGLGSRDAIQLGMELAQTTDQHVEAFVAVFRNAFLEEGLDLDILSAVKLARSLSLEFEGDVAGAREDFERIVAFCAGRKGLDLPRPQCGQLAARIAAIGKPFSGGISETFLAAFEFLRSDEGPRLSTADALRLAEEILPAGRPAGENFIQAYRYAVSKSGLSMGAREALAFAKGLTVPRSSSKGK